MLRKLQRQEAAEQAPDAEQAPAKRPPKGHPPAPGTRKVSLNIRVGLWSGTPTQPGLLDLARNEGVDPVAVIEALLERYMADEKLRDRTNDDAQRVMRARRKLAAEIRALERQQGQDTPPATAS